MLLFVHGVSLKIIQTDAIDIKLNPIKMLGKK